MQLNLGRRGGLRRAGAIVAGLLLATGAMAGAASADVGTVTTPTGQDPNPVVVGSSADYTTTAYNTSGGSDRYFKVTAIHYSSQLRLSVSGSDCTQITRHTTGTLSFTVNTNIGGTTPTGTNRLHITVSDYDNATDCGNNDDNSSNDSPHSAGNESDRATIVVVNRQGSWSVNDVSTSEGNSGTKTLTFTVTYTRHQGDSGTATVDYATGGGTATGGTSCTVGVDYITATGHADVNSAWSVVLHRGCRRHHLW